MFHFPQKTSFGLDLSDLSFKIVQFKKRKMVYMSVDVCSGLTIHCFLVRI